MIEAYAEYGAVGAIVALFGFMIINLIKSQKSQNQDLDNIRVHIGKIESAVKNVESIVIKLIDRIGRQEDKSANHRDAIISELNDVTDDLAYLKGRINGRNQ